MGFFSLETSARKLLDRQISAATGIPMDDIKRNTISPADWNKLRAAAEDISDRRLDYISAASMTVADIRTMTVERKYDVIIVDYLQLIQSTGDNRTAQFTLDVYGHVTQKMRQESADRMQKFYDQLYKE